MIVPVDDEMAQVIARSHGNRSQTIAIKKSENRLLTLASREKQECTKLKPIIIIIILKSCDKPVEMKPTNLPSHYNKALPCFTHFILLFSMF